MGALLIKKPSFLVNVNKHTDQTRNKRNLLTYHALFLVLPCHISYISSVSL